MLTIRAGPYSWHYSLKCVKLPWFKVKWKKSEEDFSQPGTLLHDKYGLLVKLIYRHISRLPKKYKYIVVTEIVNIP